MKLYVVIPAHNEEENISKTLQSLVEQTHLPSKIIVVNDNSTDNTQSIVNSFSEKYTFIESINNTSSAQNIPGSKVINAFKKGMKVLDDDFDVICKFDADLIFPNNYIETIQTIFTNNKNCGMAGGFCYIEKNDIWVLENLTNKDHIRGALKAYRKECFYDIGGLKSEMGWDTVDELLAQYHGWEIYTDESLEVKHLKPTGNAYSKKAKYKQGEAFYKMRYGIVLTKIASLKLALKKRNALFYLNSIIGFLKAFFNRSPFLVNKEEGRFIRKHRWKNILKKIF
ncbi:MAG: glycosyltransferase involved in cell wall biosynthesis [Flavobacteriaceae bacterium]|jgi:glycosyltransferase involved in cell wall biosynthesis|uniref:glycosyltransferase n=1 Tax=Candidatus Marifrigoribacter sp. Uisw_064 TaxID=3230970 RepID=UPI003ADDE158